jgi:hypothetical protein
MIGRVASFSRPRRLSVFLLFAALYGSPNEARAERWTGALYALGAPRGALLYRMEMERDEDAGRWTSRYTTAAGLPAVEDEAVWSGGALQRYSYVRHSIGERSSVERRDGKVYYSYFRDGKHSQAVEKDSDNFAVGPTVIRNIQRNWSALLNGKQIEIRYGVLDQLRSFGFEVVRDRKHPANAPGVVVMRMRPSSFFIRMFVDPTYLVISDDGQILYEMIGRMLPMERNGSRLRPIDGDLVLHKEQPSSKGAVLP